MTDEQMQSVKDDIAFIGALLDAVEQSVCVDASRVYATGVSNGGGMVARLACELSDRLAAIAPVAGGPYAIASGRRMILAGGVLFAMASSAFGRRASTRATKPSAEMAKPRAMPAR